MIFPLKNSQHFNGFQFHSVIHTCRKLSGGGWVEIQAEEGKETALLVQTS